MLRRVLCLAFFSGALLVFGLISASAEQLYTLKTKYLTLKYENVQDLNTFNEKIDFSPDTSNFSSFSGTSQSSSGTGVEKKMVNKLDALVEKVQLILDMRKPINIIIRIYPDETALHTAYFNIFNTRKKLRAWYIFEYNTIYVNAQDLFSGMLAHEIAHAIVDHFLAVRPPRATAEILARYVDRHLDEKAKVY
ncbi:MAG: hypothetical protein GY860_26625 [Desulfobacteraceae bacterium]|nr:hypothetical protein [Desulfobacteraceae bacterium]